MAYRALFTMFYLPIYYKTITAWELRKMDWVKVKAENNNGVIIEWEVAIERLWTFILHNNAEANGKKANDMRWYEYSRLVFYKVENDGQLTRRIKRLETIENFVEWEEVYVSDHSIEHAIDFKNKKIYLCTLPKWKKYKYVCVYDGHGKNFLEWKDYEASMRKHIAKIPKEETVEMTMEEVCKALGKKVKIIE